MTYGQLGEAVDRARRAQPLRGPLASSDGGAVGAMVDDFVAWQMSGTGTRQAMAVPAVYASVRLIASTIDQLRITAPGDPSWLRDPRLFGSQHTQGQLVQHIVTSMLIRGRAYLRAERVGGSWLLQPLDDDAVQAQRSVDPATGVLGAQFRVMGQPLPKVAPPGESAYLQPWPTGSVWLVHIPYLVTGEHPEGIGPIQAARESLGGYLTVERQAATLLDRGTVSGGVLETDQDITADTARRYQEAWGHGRKTGSIPVLGAGLRYRNDIISPKDAAWLESRQFNAQQVAQLFGIPPDYLGMSMSGGSSSLSYNNSADNDRRYRRNCLEALTNPIREQLSTLLDVQRDTVEWDWQAWESAGTATDAEEDTDA